MGLQIGVTPVVGSNGNGMPTTEIDLSIDVSSIINMIAIYDLLLKITLTVNSVNIITSEQEVNSYDFAQVYSNINNSTINFSTTVWGNITDSTSVVAQAEGIFINKV